MWQFETAVSEIIQRTPSVKSFRFPRPPGTDFDAGQYFFVTIKIDGQEANHHFTISSSPTDLGYLEFTKRITEHEFSQALDRMKPGDWANLAGPLGAFTLPKTKQKLAFLSGGIGITPLRSMLRYIHTRRDPWDIVLLYGNTSVEEIVFRDELEEYAAAGLGLRIVHVISGPNVPPDWKGKTGMINADLVAEVVPDCTSRIFYVSGPPRMVISLEDQLVRLNVPDDHLKRDSFTGYD